MNLKISPSKLPRVWECTGFPFLAQGIEETISAYAEMGVMAHVCTLGAVKAGDPSEVMNLVDGFDESKGITFEIARKWEEHACIMLGVITTTPLIEVKLAELQDLGMVPSGREGEHQADLVWLDEDCSTWNILDYKSGKTAVPHPKENKQLWAYGWALMKREGLLNGSGSVRLWIYQPEVGSEPIAFLVPMEAIRAFGEECKAKIKEAEAGGQLKEGPHCTYCPVQKAKTCPLINNRKDNRREVVDMAKATASEALAPLTEIQSIPKLAEEIEIPAAVKEALAGLVVRESEILAVSQGNMQSASDLLKEVGIFETKVDEARAVTKKPFMEAGKAVDAAFKTVLDPLKNLKDGLKGKLQSFLEIQERARRQEEARQKEEQDRIAKELAAKEAAANKLKGAAKAKAEAEAQKLREEQAQASIVQAPAPVMKPSGVAVKEVFWFKIPDFRKIPERYLLPFQGEVSFEGPKNIVIMEIDGKTLSADAKAGRLKNFTWLTWGTSSAVSAR